MSRPDPSEGHNTFLFIGENANSNKQMNISTVLMLSVVVYATLGNPIRIPQKGYRDMRDTVRGRPVVDDVYEEYAGNERPFADVLHHNRFNLEELMLPHEAYVPEILDQIKLEQAQLGANKHLNDEFQMHVIKRAKDKITPYSANPLMEKKIKESLALYRIYDD